MSSRKKIAIIGECMIELNGEPFGPMMQTFGGDTLNSAVYLARSAKNVDVFYVTAMGTEPLSLGMIQRWQEEGINTELVLQDASRQPGLYVIQLDQYGERTFLYWRNQSAARYLLQHRDFDTIKQNLLLMDMVCLSGITVAILPEEDRLKLIVLLNELSANGVQIAFDTNFRPALWPQEAEWTTVKSDYQPILSMCDIALVTFDDEQALWLDNSPEETLNRLKCSGVKEVVVKLGAEGCLYQHFATMETPVLVPTKAVENVVDTTSAGDSFNAGFLAGYLTGQSIQASCIQGHQLAGAVIQHKGAVIPRSATKTVTEQFASNQ